ncbi:C40 family peptidase [Streptomyces sp. NPDC056652]|uniref:C40 family peptidase n=1 Tax=Streptomyces sp. NPDC056652 TaxID=3345893 RepID=UPI00368A90F4
MPNAAFPSDPSRLSRRGLIATLGTAVALPLVAPHTVSYARTPGVTPAAAAAVAGTAGGSLTGVTIAGNDASAYASLSLGTLTAVPLTGTPGQLSVRHGDTEVALLTTGARTVRLPGPERTFVENKKPFTDDFGRERPADWGNSPAGGSWSTVNGADTDYTVQPGAGTIVLSSANLSRHATLLDDMITDVDVRVDGSFDRAPAGAALSFALSFGYRDTKNHCRARVVLNPGGTAELRIEREQADTTTLLTPAVALPSSSGTVPWSIRVRRTGDLVEVRAWQTAGAEPTAWTAKVTDSVFRQGRVGVRALASTGSTNLPVRLRVTRFRVCEGRWAVAPAVTHREWIRLLPEPFDGVWTTALERTVRGWAGSTAPDVLAYAFMFVSGAPEVRSVALGGARVLGEAGYGPTEADGTLSEGADFHEYMGLPWTFPVGGTNPAPEDDSWHDNLDCSGYIRMVYGHHSGVPLAAGDDPTRSALPRRSHDQSLRSPGVTLARAVGQPPATSQLLPGDLLFFDAEASESGEIDHVGIYLGTDHADRRRFLSSRKTPDGPTMADLGGPSTLDGDGLYARTLRTVHRI